MANHAAKEGLVTVDGGTILELTSWNFDESLSTIDDSELSDAAESFVSDKTSWTGSITVHWDDSDTTGQDVLILGASVAVIFLPEGNTTGDISYTGTALVDGVSRSGDIGSMVGSSFSLKGVGALTAGTVA